MTAVRASTRRRSRRTGHLRRKQHVLPEEPLRGRQAARTGCGRGVVAAQHEEHGGDHRHDVEACGQFVALPGASGAGKSTLLRRVVRLDSVDGGTIDAPAQPA